VAEVAPPHPELQRRRSERISKSLPLIVRGIDLLGQPFEERTSTVTLNLHGCRYVSKHHLPKNTWVTLEVPQEPRRRHVRARVAWIQRPHSVREFFQIAVELESPANIWNVTYPPTSWESSETPVDPAVERLRELEPRIPEPAMAASEKIHSTEKFWPNMTNEHSETASAQPGSTGENPLLLQWSAELGRQAAEAAGAAAARVVERVEQAVEDFTRLEKQVREDFSSQTASQQALLGSFKSELQNGLEQARERFQDLDRSAEALRREYEAALEGMSRLSDGGSWRERLESEMATAQVQWNELLQSSLDSNVGRLVEHLAGRSQEMLRLAEQTIADRFTELRQPWVQMSSEARDTLGSVRRALEEELGRANASLAEIEHATARMKEYSERLETASHDTLNELHRRLENILEERTDEMSTRAEHLVTGVSQRLSPLLDSFSQQAVERTIAEIDVKLAPRLEQASELVRGLASRGAEADETLRLHRERLRQVSENGLREAAAQTAATLSGLRGDFESARKEALTKWSEELDASAVRTSHAAVESIERSSERFQQDTRTRLQLMAEQTIESATGSFEEKMAEAARRFETRLEEHSFARVSEIRQHLDGVASEITSRTRSQLDEAAEAAAASFGQVLRRVSEEETANFTAASRSTLAERQRDLGSAAAQLLQNLEANAQASIEQFRAQMASQLEGAIAEGRSSLTTEFASALHAHHAEREAHEKRWTDDLQRMSDEAVARHRDRLQNASDSWVVSSVRRLNEHGQTAIESLMNSADEMVRDSCAQLFQGISQMLRERPSRPSLPLGFPAGSERDAGETAPSHSESATGANA
jgi:hypothetical protein